MGKNSYKIWTEDEENFLKDNKDKLSAKEIGEKLDRSEKSVMCHARYIDISLAKDSEHHSQRKYDINHNLFRPPSQKSYYWAGFLFADGNIAKDANLIQLELHKKDKNHLEKIKSDFDTNYPIKHIADDVVRISMTSRKLVKDLFDIGVVPQKSKMNIRPKVPQKYTRDFIRGVFDGDGSISGENDPCVEIDNSERTCNWLKNKTNEAISISGTINHHSIGQKTFRWQIWGRNQIKKFANWLYKNAEVFMERKYKRYNNYGIVS